MWSKVASRTGPISTRLALRGANSLATFKDIVGNFPVAGPRRGNHTTRQMLAEQVTEFSAYGLTPAASLTNWLAQTRRPSDVNLAFERLLLVAGKDRFQPNSDSRSG